MREIKFRAIAVSSGRFVYGNFIHSKRFEGCSNEFRIHQSESGIESDVHPETVGQFTGLKDKNGVDVFEGDVLEYQYEDSCEELGFGINKAIVCFQEGKFCCKQVDFDYDKIGYTPESLAKWTRGEEITISGNIHENTQP